MKVEDFKAGCGFIVEGVSFSRLCECLAEHPGVTFTDRRRFFWSAADIRAEFIFRDCTFKIEPWNMDDSIFVSPKDKGAEAPEITELRDHVAEWIQIFIPRDWTFLYLWWRIIATMASLVALAFEFVLSRVEQSTADDVTKFKIS